MSRKKYNFFLESDDDDEKDKDYEEDDEKDDDDDDDDSSTDNDYLGGDDSDSDSDDDDSDSDDYDDDSASDNDYLGSGEDYSDSDSGSGESALFNKIAKIVYAMVVVSNNFFHIHTHCKGKKFNDIHSFAETCRNEILWKIDDYAEIALQDPSTKLDNFCNAARYVPEITPCDEDVYDYTAALTAISDNYKRLIDITKDARSCSDSRTDIQSKLDDFLGYLNKQVKYIIERRLGTEDVNESYSLYI